MQDATCSRALQEDADVAGPAESSPNDQQLASRSLTLLNVEIEERAESAEHIRGPDGPQRCRLALDPNLGLGLAWLNGGPPSAGVAEVHA